MSTGCSEVLQEDNSQTAGRLATRGTLAWAAVYLPWCACRFEPLSFVLFMEAHKKRQPEEELTMAHKTYAITGATGHVGKVVVERLKSQGHQVRRIARSAGVDVNEALALARAFEGAFFC